MAQDKTTAPGLKAIHKIVFAIVALTLIALIIVAILGALNLTDGCLYRYSTTTLNGGTGGGNSSVIITQKSFQLRADGNYSVTKQNYTTINSDGTPSTYSGYGPSPNEYGKWLRVNFPIAAGQDVSITLSGEISLCRAYAPMYNMQQDINTDNDGNKIPIPRVNESTAPMAYIASAQATGWGNVAFVEPGDKIEVMLGKNYAPVYDGAGNIVQDVNAVNVYNFFSKSLVTANCTENQHYYDSICGRYSPFSPSYVDHCEQNSNGDWQNVVWIRPPYRYNHEYTASRSEYFGELFRFGDRAAPNPDCTKEEGRNTIADSSYSDVWGAWFTADDSAGLLQRESNTGTLILGRGTLGGSYSFAPTPDQNRIIYKSSNVSASAPYFLQYYLYDPGPHSDNTGGYVFYLRQTKCVRSKGSYATDSGYTNRGQVKYLILDSNLDPNKDSNLATQALKASFNSSGTANLIPQEGYLWLSIDNATADYPDSFGSYAGTMVISESTSSGGNITTSFDVLDTIFLYIKQQVQDVTQNILGNMVCYKFTDKSSCSNLFNYIRAMLMLFVIMQSAMFLLGFVEINLRYLVISVLKVIVVAAIINENTVQLIFDDVLNFVTSIAGTLIGNISGYASYTSTAINGTTVSSNPFGFANQILTKIFSEQTFIAQIFALLAFGIQGIIYFILTLLGVIIFIVTIFRAIAVYVMAFTAQAVLVIVSPIFLVFMLFEETEYLFENWVKFFVRYTLEPVIMLAGVMILTQLFTVYIDYLLAYSVCWKCAISFTIPFNIPPITDIAATQIPLFCINWFVPWGFDNNTSTISISMGMVAGVMMIAYCLYKYVEFSSNITMQLTSAVGPSAVSIGMQAAKAAGQLALRQIGLDADTRGKVTHHIQSSKRESLKEEKKRNKSDSNYDKDDKNGKEGPKGTANNNNNEKGQ